MNATLDVLQALALELADMQRRFMARAGDESLTTLERACARAEASAYLHAVHLTQCAAERAKAAA